MEHVPCIAWRSHNDVVLWPQTYMSHLAAYYDPEDGEEGDQPFLQELADMGGVGAGSHSPDSDVERGTATGQRYAQAPCVCSWLSVLPGRRVCVRSSMFAEFREMKWYEQAFAVVNFPANLVRAALCQLLECDALL